MRFLLNRAHRSAAAWSFLTTFLRMGVNVFVLPLLLRKLPNVDYGVWMVFGSIGALAGLLDMGFEFTITRMTAYAWGGATKFLAFGLHQEPAPQGQHQPNLPLLRDLFATIKAYYLYAGIGVLLLLGGGGTLWIWIATRDLVDAGSLRLAWGVYAAGCWLNFVVGRWPALLSGVGAVRQAQQATILSQIAYYVIVVAGLLGGLGIWAMVWGSVGMGVIARHQGKVYFLRTVVFPDGMPRAHFHREIFHAIWPNAWRTGMVIIGAYLTVYANTLVCNAFLGLGQTGDYGLSFQLVTILFSLCNVWLGVKLPHINALRQQNRTAEIIELFARRMRLALLSYVAGGLVIIFIAPTAIHFIKSHTALIATGPLAALALFRLLELHHSLYASLIFTENQNPFVKSSLISGVSIVVASVILTPLMGLWGMILSMGVVQLCFNNWWPVLRGLKGLGVKPGAYFAHQYLRPKAWLELF